MGKVKVDCGLVLPFLIEKERAGRHGVFIVAIVEAALFLPGEGDLSLCYGAEGVDPLSASMAACPVITII